MNTEKIFKKNGAKFISPAIDITKKLDKIKIFVFDWDGVFNQGYKSQNYHSPFSEADSMGINMLRFGFWLENKKIPPTGIITGMNNPAAKFFAQREHLNFIFEGIKHKKQAINKICKAYKIKPNEIAFIFDDILDISAAKICGLRFMVKHTDRPLFQKIVTKNNFCDYISYNTVENQAVREISELILGLKGIYENTINNRIEYSKKYQNYIEKRQKITPTEMHK